LTAMKNAARKELEIMEAVTTIEKCKALVAYFKRSGLNSELPSTLKQEVETRWDSFRTMLVSVDNNWDEVRRAIIITFLQFFGERGEKR